MTAAMAISTLDAAWELVLTAARLDRLGFDRRKAFDITPDEHLPASPSFAGSHRLLSWIPDRGWVSSLPLDDPRAPLVDLYLPLAGTLAGSPLTVGHLGQSLDGFIATATGDSYYVTGEENVRHLHRMRALSDAVIVGAGTVAADDPQLTTRHVKGPNPLRVVIDRTRRLDNQYRVFNDGQSPTLLVCADGAREPWPRSDQVEILKLPAPEGRLDLAALVGALHARGCTRLFVEGGGVTVSGFLQAGLLDRLQIAVAPLLIGDGRPAIRLPGKTSLGECLRPRQRVFRLGNDVLFECILGSAVADAPAPEADFGSVPATIARIL